MAYHIIGYQTNPITGETIFNILCDTVADLPASPVSDNGYGGEIGQGSSALVIETGRTYIANSSAAWVLQPVGGGGSADTYTKAEIDEMITEIYEIIAYYHTTLVSDTGEITFYALDGYIGTWTIFGNGQQTGTPTHDNPVMPDFCGTLDGTDWKIPLTCAGQTVPVYLGQVSTVRKIGKVVLTGQETGWGTAGGGAQAYLKLTNTYNFHDEPSNLALSSHFIVTYNAFSSGVVGLGGLTTSESSIWNGNVVFYIASYGTLDAWKAYLAAQYSAGTPVTVWYVLASEQTGIVNEPLCKISTYADELHSADAGVAIPTVKGENTLTVGTILKPSRIEIQG